MSTRSRIGVEDDETGVVKSIYCHSDGYPHGVGQTLIEHYINRDKAKALIALGDISCLGAELGEKHAFDGGMQAHPTWTLAYQRDRGEAAPGREEENAETMYAHAVEGWEEYAYLLRQGVWFCTKVGGGAGPFLVTAADPDGKAPSRWERVEAVLAKESA